MHPTLQVFGARIISNVLRVGVLVLCVYWLCLSRFHKIQSNVKPLWCFGAASAKKTLQFCDLGWFICNILGPLGAREERPLYFCDLWAQEGKPSNILWPVGTIDGNLQYFVTSRRHKGGFSNILGRMGAGGNSAIFCDLWVPEVKTQQHFLTYRRYGWKYRA